MKILVDGVLYETLMTNERIDSVVPIIKKQIYSGNFYKTNGHVLTVNISDVNNYVIRVLVYCKVSDDIRASNRFIKENIAEMLIEIKHGRYTEKDDIKLDETIYHEFLHVIDPKSHDIKLLQEPFSIYYDVGHSKYFNQILEREQMLSARAKVIVETLKKSNYDIKKEITNNFEHYFTRLNPALHTPSNRRLFAKMLYLYYERIR